MVTFAMSTFDDLLALLETNTDFDSDSGMTPRGPQVSPEKGGKIHTHEK